MTWHIELAVTAYLVITTMTLVGYVLTTPVEHRRVWSNPRTLLWGWVWCLGWPLALLWWVTRA